MRLLHIDIETTGLDPETCVITEVAASIIDYTNDTRVDFHWITSSDPSTLPWQDVALKMAVESGLYDAILAECEKAIRGELRFAGGPETQLANWIIRNRATGLQPCGFSVQFDREFIAKHWPRVRQLMHGHRIFDLSTLRTIYKPTLSQPIEALTAHRAQNDVETGNAFLCAWLVDAEDGKVRM